MHLKRRSLGVLVATALLAASVAGCDSSAVKAQPGSQSKTLEMWTFKQAHVAGLQAAATAFEKSTGVHVKIVVATPQEAYITKIQAAAKSKTLPDLITVGSGDESFKYGAAGILKDMTAVFDSQMQADMLPGIAVGSQLTQAAIDNSSGQSSLKSLKAGSWYALPYVAGASGIIVARKSALAEAGVDVKVASSSWENLVKSITATHAKSAATGGIVAGLQIPETAYQWLYRPMAYYYLGKDAFYQRQGRSGTSLWESADSLKTFELYDQMTPLWAPGVLALGIDQADQSFAQGKAAWDVGGTYTIPFLLEQGLKASDIAMFPTPAPEGAKISQVGVSSFPILSAGVTTQTKDATDAIKFAKYISDGAGATLFAQATSEVPASAKAADSLASDPLLGPVLDAMKSASGTAFNADDFSADPTTTPPVKHASAVDLAKLITKGITPAQLGPDYAAIYKEAWGKIK